MCAIILDTCFDVAEKVYNVPANKGRTTALQIKLIRNQWEGNFPGGPVADSPLPLQGAQVRSLVRELDPARHNRRHSLIIKGTRHQVRSERESLLLVRGRRNGFLGSCA